MLYGYQERTGYASFSTSPTSVLLYALFLHAKGGPTPAVPADMRARLSAVGRSVPPTSRPNADRTNPDPDPEPKPTPKPKPKPKPHPIFNPNQLASAPSCEFLNRYSTSSVAEVRPSPAAEPQA